MPLPERQSVPTQGQVGNEPAETGAILRRILEGVEATVGEQFFPSLVQQLATSLGVDYAYISELSDDGSRFRSKAAWGRGRPLPPFDVPAKGPCEVVLTKKCVYHPDQLRELYPQVQLIQDIGVELLWSAGRRYAGPGAWTFGDHGFKTYAGSGAGDVDPWDLRDARFRRVRATQVRARPA